MRVLLIDPMTAYDDQINLGPVSVGSYAKSLGHDVRIVDMNFRKHDAYDRLMTEIEQLNPDIIGISIMSYFAFGEVRKLLHYLTALKSKIVVGGASPSMFPEKMLAENPEIDFLIFGEGEKTFTDLLEVLQHDKNKPVGLFSGHVYCNKCKTSHWMYGPCPTKAVALTPGLAYRDRDKIIVNAKRPLIENLDSLPPLDFDIIDLVRDYGFTYYRDTYTIATSRGCPYNCCFCLSKTLSNRRWRCFSAERVVDEIENAVHKYGLHRISFQDDNFVMKPQRVIEICRLIRERKLEIKICLEGGIRADRLTEESFQALRETGLDNGFLGVESGSPEVFNQMGKGETLEDIEKAIQMLQSADMDLQLYMILGLPGATHETFLESVAFAKKYNAKCRWHLAFPFEGTGMYDYVVKHGRFLRNCAGYDVDVMTGNDVTTPGTMPLGFDTPEYPVNQRIADYYAAVIDSENFFYILGAKYGNGLRGILRCLLLVMRYKPSKLGAYASYILRIATRYLRRKTKGV